MFFVLIACVVSEPKESVVTESTPDSTPTDSTPTDSVPEEEPHWSYEGETGPEHWGELSEEWALCGTGTQQSPIDIDPSTLVSAANDVTLAWHEIKLRAYNSGHYIRYEVDEESLVSEESVAMVNGDTYVVKQFHFHALSEHTVQGQQLGMELHVVHQKKGSTENNDLLVVGFFFDNAGYVDTTVLGPDALNLASALELPESEEPTDLGSTFDLGILAATVTVPASYMGSLTTPPCTEGVRFVLSGGLLRPMPGEIEAFQAVYDFNFRPVQPLNGRELLVLDQ